MREMENYVFAKHGIERNEYMRRQAAENYAEAFRDKARKESAAKQQGTR